MNKIALITGATSGIGKASAEKFAQNGWDVIGVDKYLRGYFLQSEDAETKGQIQELQKKYSNIVQYDYDINDIEKMKE